MKLKVIFQLVIVLTFISCTKTNTCAIETTEGIILIELYPEKAPITVANFLKYVDEGLYTNSSFFRVTTPENEVNREIKIEVIQGGNVEDGKEFPPIEIETTDKTGIKHINGAISMARGGVNTATSSFFICINAQPELDFEGKRNPNPKCIMKQEMRLQEEMRDDVTRKMIFFVLLGYFYSVYL